MISVGNIVKLRVASTFRKYEVPRWVRAFEPDDLFLFLTDVTASLGPGRPYGRYVFVCPDNSVCACDDLEWAEDHGPLANHAADTQSLRNFRRRLREVAK